MTYGYVNKLKGTLKGIFGEILFKSQRSTIFCTKLCSPNVIEKLPFILPQSHKTFLKEFWGSLDCFEFLTARDKKGELFHIKTTLYEVKTRNHNPKAPALFQKFTFTSNQIQIYLQAQALGIAVFVAKIVFYDNWKYLLKIHDFNPKKYRYLICNGQKKSCTSGEGF